MGVQHDTRHEVHGGTHQQHPENGAALEVRPSKAPSGAYRKHMDPALFGVGIRAWARRLSRHPQSGHTRS